MAAPLVALLLAGCTSIGGVQMPITAADIKQADFCPSQLDIVGMNSLSGLARGAYRNNVVMLCIKAINRRYDEFKAMLHQESTGSNLFTDIASLAATTGASISSGSAAKRLSAAGAFLIGTGSAINKDVFYQQTLPAIEAAMDTRRDHILKNIIDAENGDPNGTTYSLTSAGIDLDALQGAGNIYGGISELTKTANVAAQQAANARSASEQGLAISLEEPTFLPEAALSRTAKLVSFVKGLKDPADRPKLEGLARALGISFNAADRFEDLQGRVVGQIVVRARVSADKQEAAIAALEGTINPFIAGGGK
ncbi:MAG TPA: hypothetical protein VGD66_15200 [Allosphingosinicella sp.]